MYIIDHNVLIDIENKREIGLSMQRHLMERPKEFCVINIGASELRLGGIRPDRYDLFENFLEKIGLENLKRIDPLALVDITFINRCRICSDEDVALYEKVNNALFPNGYESGVNLIYCPPYEPIERKALNQICDTVGLWCHLKYKTSGFVTSDRNFVKKSVELSERFGANVLSAEAFA